MLSDGSDKLQSTGTGQQKRQQPQTRNYVAQLAALGYRVTLEPVA
jgi:hypothetical protein